jgi:hypothetical protein
MQSDDYVESLRVKLRTSTLRHEANEERIQFFQNQNEQTKIELSKLQHTVELMQQEKERIIENVQLQVGPVLAMSFFD